MRHVVSASLIALACALAQPASAQLEDKPVPMDKAPFHIPVFSNDYLILLNVNIPPGRNTGYHIHYADSVSVNLTPASQTNQNYGSSGVNPPGARAPHSEPRPAAGAPSLRPRRRTGRDGARIGRSRHGSVCGRFHLAGCRADEGGEEHRHDPNRIHRIRAEIAPLLQRVGFVIATPDGGYGSGID